MRAGGTDLFGEKDRTPKPIVECLEPDMVNHPPHYDLGDIQLIDIMIASQGIEAVQHFCACNVLKYVFRHQNKNGAEDMNKARWYIDEWLKLEESK